MKKPLSQRATRILLLIFIVSIILFAVLLTTLVLQGESPTDSEDVVDPTSQQDLRNE